MTVNVTLTIQKEKQKFLNNILFSKLPSCINIITYPL